jgi:ABC-type transport system substrate-binding protein
VLNLGDTDLADAVFRQALACMIDPNNWAKDYSLVQVVPIRGPVSPGNLFWYNPNADIPCSGADLLHRVNTIMGILKVAGYSWDKEFSVSGDEVLGPTIIQGWEGLKRPNGDHVPKLQFIAPDSRTDPFRADLAAYIVKRLQFFGIPVHLQLTDSGSVNYAVFSSHQFDMAILGWQVSEYPGYLCDWFGDGNPFGYHSDRLRSACEALDSTSDLAAAQKQVYEIQSILAQDLPFIPLYSGVTYDAYRNIAYPFDSVPGGLSGVYGAPSLAIPASP